MPVARPGELVEACVPALSVEEVVEAVRSTLGWAPNRIAAATPDSPAQVVWKPQLTLALLGDDDQWAWYVVDNVTQVGHAVTNGVGARLSMNALREALPLAPFEALLARFEAEADPGRRRELLLAAEVTAPPSVATAEHPGLLAAIAGALAPSEPLELRRAALDVAGRLPWPSLVPLAEAVLADVDDDVELRIRAAALRELGVWAGP